MVASKTMASGIWRDPFALRWWAEGRTGTGSTTAGQLDEAGRGGSERASPGSTSGAADPLAKLRKGIPAWDFPKPRPSHLSSDENGWPVDEYTRSAQPLRSWAKGMGGGAGWPCSCGPRPVERKGASFRWRFPQAPSR